MSEFKQLVFEAVREIVVEAVTEGRARSSGVYDVGDDFSARIAEAVEGLRRNRRSVRWDQRAIVEWQNATFGEPRSNLGIAIRANEEMAELLRCLSSNDTDQAARAEIADVVTVLCRLSERLGGTIVGDVEAKMEVNAKRVWKRGRDGHGRHVREKGDDATTEAPKGCGICGYRLGHATNCYVIKDPD